MQHFTSATLGRSRLRCLLLVLLLPAVLFLAFFCARSVVVAHSTFGALPLASAAAGCGQDGANERILADFHSRGGTVVALVFAGRQRYLDIQARSLLSTPPATPA